MYWHSKLDNPDNTDTRQVPVEEVTPICSPTLLQSRKKSVGLIKMYHILAQLDACWFTLSPFLYCYA
jgi:hypothetical protein